MKIHAFCGLGGLGDDRSFTRFRRGYRLWWCGEQQRFAFAVCVTAFYLD